MSKLWTPKQTFDVPAPRNAKDRALLCGFNERACEEYWASEAASRNHATFFVAGQTKEREDTVRLWDIFRQVTGMDPDVTPQPDGDCVAAGARDTVECLQALEIFKGDREEFREIHPTFHYATGRVLVGKNQLRGSAGSIGGWQATAIKKYGVLDASLPGIPNYNKATSQAWGDDKKVGGVSFRDFMDAAADRVVRETARVKPIEEVFDSLSNKYPLTIAASFGYTMKPNRDGYHRASGSWSHQMSLWGYSISGNWVAIKNQWGRAAHGKLIDFETEEPWPPGFLRVPISDFENHLRRAECIAYSNFDGFPEQLYDYSKLG